MDFFSADQELGVESELIDLSAVSMTVLRESDDTMLKQALQHVMQQSVRPRATAVGDQCNARESLSLPYQ